MYSLGGVPNVVCRSQIVYKLALKMDMYDYYYHYCLSVSEFLFSLWDSHLNSQPIIQNNLYEMPTINNAVRQC